MRMQWPILVKLGMWVVVDTSTTHVVCHHGMRLFNTSFAYLFWLANNKKGNYPEFCMGYSDKSWYMGTDGHKYPHGLSSPNALFNTSFAYLFWLTEGQFFNNADFWLPEGHFLTTLISDHQDICQQCWFLTARRPCQIVQTSRALLNISPMVAHAVHSVKIAST